MDFGPSIEFWKFEPLIQNSKWQTKVMKPKKFVSFCCVFSKSIELQFIRAENDVNAATEYLTFDFLGCRDR